MTSVAQISSKLMSSQLLVVLLVQGNFSSLKSEASLTETQTLMASCLILRPLETWHQHLKKGSGSLMRTIELLLNMKCRMVSLESSTAITKVSTIHKLNHADHVQLLHSLVRTPHALNAQTYGMLPKGNRTTLTFKL